MAVPTSTTPSQSAAQLRLKVHDGTYQLEMRAQAWAEIQERGQDAHDYCQTHIQGQWGKNIWHLILDDVIKLRKLIVEATNELKATTTVVSRLAVEREIAVSNAGKLEVEIARLKVENGDLQDRISRLLWK